MDPRFETSMLLSRRAKEWNKESVQKYIDKIPFATKLL